MKQSNKIKTIVILILLIIFGIIAARHFVGLHFKKKFSVRPAPGVIISKVDETIFFKSIETFGTAIARNSKTYRVKENDIVGNFNIDGRFVKKGDIIVALKDNQNIESFGVFHNGSKIKPEQLIRLEITNYKNQKISKEVKFRQIEPYETIVIKLYLKFFCYLS